MTYPKFVFVILFIIFSTNLNIKAFALNVSMPSSPPHHIDIPETKSVEEYVREAEQGDSFEKYNLGHMFEYGVVVPKDYKKAFEWYSKAAKQVDNSYGHIKSQYHLGEMYFNGMGVKQDYEEAFEYFLKAAKEGYYMAQHDIGAMYDRGIGVTRDSEKAFEWYSKAANKNYPPAQYSLGDMYYEGRDNISKDINKAVQWYNKAALGRYSLHYPPSISFEETYDTLSVIPQNYKNALGWFTEAAQRGESEAQYSLGMMYLKGEGVTQNKIKAVEWLTKSARQSFVKSQFSLGFIYKNDHGDIKDLRKSEEWLNKAAKQNFVPSQYELGLLYKDYLNDYKKSVYWLTKAAEQGDVSAQWLLANMYYKTNDNSQDYGFNNKIKSYVWYSVAIKNGLRDFGERDAIIKLMTKEELEKADKLVHEYSEKYKSKNIKQENLLMYQ